ncbi:hypothetical protein [Actinopolyspora lacussalsi]|nr:hypothetical protein [Actinopolyspora righensis]
MRNKPVRLGGFGELRTFGNTAALADLFLTPLLHDDRLSTVSQTVG